MCKRPPVRLRPLEPASGKRAGPKNVYPPKGGCDGAACGPLPSGRHITPATELNLRAERVPSWRRPVRKTGRWSRQGTVRVPSDPPGATAEAKEGAYGAVHRCGGDSYRKRFRVAVVGRLSAGRRLRPVPQVPYPEGDGIGPYRRWRHRQEGVEYSVSQNSRSSPGTLLPFPSVLSSIGRVPDSIWVLRVRTPQNHHL